MFVKTIRVGKTARLLEGGGGRGKGGVLETYGKASAQAPVALVRAYTLPRKPSMAVLLAPVQLQLLYQVLHFKQDWDVMGDSVIFAPIV